MNSGIDFKIAYNSDGSFALVEFPEPLADDGREVVTVRATFRVDGRKYYLHLPVTRRILNRHASELKQELERQVYWYATHTENLAA